MRTGIVGSNREGTKGIKRGKTCGIVKIKGYLLYGNNTIEVYKIFTYIMVI